MNYGEFKELCGKSWEEDYNYLCIDRSKKGDQGKYCICNESKKNIYRSNTSDETFLIIIQKLESVFKSFKCYIQLKIEKI